MHNPSREGFMDWLKSKDPSESFKYFSPEKCAFAQYLKANGYPEARVAGTDYARTHSGAYYPLPPGVAQALAYPICASVDTNQATTFGGVLAALQEQDRVRGSDVHQN